VERENSLSKISEIDAQILKLLLQDGRKSFTEIAKLCGTTKSQIWKHYKVMEKQGIITGATVQINFNSFGYDALVNLLISVEAQQVEQIMECIGRITEVRAYRQYNTIFNIRAVAALKNLNELDHVKAAIRRQLSTIAIRTYLWTAVKNMPENLELLTNTKKIDNVCEFRQLSSNTNRIERARIDELDLQIIEKLTVDGRAPFSAIAKGIGTSTDTVLKRYQKLIRRGAIKVIIQIDPKKLGYCSILDFNIAATSPVNSSTIVELLAKIPDVVIITKTSGDYDLQLAAMIRTVDQMFELQEDIARIPGITKIETSARKIPDRWPTEKQYISTF
jgi:DNA-binding Lrp family transcriptional regulator